MKKFGLIAALLVSSFVNAAHVAGVEKTRESFIACVDSYDFKGAQAILKKNPDFDVFGKTGGDENLLEYAIGVAVETRDSDSGKIVLAMHGHPSFDKRGGLSQLKIGYAEFMQRWYVDSFTYGDESTMPKVVLDQKLDTAVCLDTIDAARGLIHFAGKSTTTVTAADTTEVDLYCYDEKEIGISDLFS